MNRLIDADALRERLQNLAYDDWNQGITTSFADACHEIIEIVEEQPTIAPSAQPDITRCRDCNLYDGRPCGIVDYYNSADDFCSRAERRQK